MSELLRSPRVLRRSRTRWGALLLAVGLGWSAGCQRAPAPEVGATPALASPAAATASPGASAPAAGWLSYEEIVTAYQAPVPEAENAWPLLRPLLVAEGDQPAPFEDPQAWDLGTPEGRQRFDDELLPKLREASARRYLVESHSLLSGQDPIGGSYRQLRALCDLSAQRAEQRWAEGQKKEALALIRIPLALARALQNRPETVSVNLFSSAYANAALAKVADWASQGELQGPEIEEVAKILAEFRPSYEHLTGCLSVDFAQLDRSLQDEPTRTGVLGLGLAKAEEVASWRQQVEGLRLAAVKLYSFEGVDPQAFNAAVLKLSPQVQGLVLDYPDLTTMQSHAYASYLATELAVALERHRLEKAAQPLTEEELLAKVFSDDATNRTAAQGLLLYEAGPEASRFRLLGRDQVFHLASPGAPVVFYQRQGSPPAPSVSASPSPAATPQGS